MAIAAPVLQFRRKVATALANAVADATDVRIRELPISAHALSLYSFPFGDVEFSARVCNKTLMSCTA